MTATTNTTPVHPLLPLAVLQAVRGLDEPPADGLEEFHADLSSKRLGMSSTVAVQIDRFDRLARSGARVNPEELVALLRLVGRRHDAGLVFTDAGRRAGRHAVQRVGRPFPRVVRTLPRILRRRVGLGLAARAVRAVFNATLRGGDGGPHATVTDAPSAHAAVAGAACAFYGAGLAEVLRLLTDFEGALFHVSCRARGDAQCEWRASPVEGSEAVA